MDRDLFNKAFSKITPNNFDKVISKINKKEGVILEMKEEKKRSKFLFPSFALAAVILGFLGFMYYGNVKEFASIGFDVNPSVEVVVNKELKVIKTIANNEDGKLILGTMDFKGSTLEVATNALIGSMLRNGFIDEAKNSVLVSVESNYKGEAEKIRTELTSNIDEILKSSVVSASVMSQVIDTDNSLVLLAKEYNTSVGKIKLIQEIIANNNLYKMEELVKLNVNELNLLATSKKNNVTNVEVKGTASDKTYIGASKAKEIALTNSGVNASSATKVEVEFDLENGIMVYEVEFTHNKVDYDYEINATTGAIIKGEKDLDDEDDIKIIKNNSNSSNSNNNTNTSYISKSKAKEIALNHSGVKTPKDYSIEFEYKAGKGIYEIEFEYGNKEYDYEINALTGAIIKSHSKVDNDLDDEDDD